MQSKEFPPTLGAPFPQAKRRIPWRETELTGTIFFLKPNSRKRRSVIAGLVLGGVLATAHAAPTLASDVKPDADGKLTSDDGTIDLVWDGGSAPYELQQARDASFSDARTRYEGEDAETVLTGLADGVYHFRVREVSSGGWSEPLVVNVESMNRGTLFLLLGTGAFVAVSTIGSILYGYHKNR